MGKALGVGERHSSPPRSPVESGSAPALPPPAVDPGWVTDAPGLLVCWTETLPGPTTQACWEGVLVRQGEPGPRVLVRGRHSKALAYFYPLTTSLPRPKVGLSPPTLTSCFIS